MAKRKKARRMVNPEADLNIMPFIDIFSMLNTFLLVSAAFVNIGLIEVQVPFLTNAPPPKDKPPRSLEINVMVTKKKINLDTKFDKPPINEKRTEYEMTKEGIDRLHKDLVELKKKNPKSEKVSVFSDDDVRYNNLVKVLDSIMLRRKEDPIFTEKNVKGIDKDSEFIYRKVTMASVLL